MCPLWLLQLLDLDRLDSQDEAPVVQRKRLDFHPFCKHFHRHRPTGPLRACLQEAAGRWQCIARLCYWFQLTHAAEKKAEMLAALQLGLSARCEECCRYCLSSTQINHQVRGLNQGEILKRRSLYVVRCLHLRTNYATVWGDNR